MWFVGSGAAARSYLIEVDGFLYEAPVSYYASGAEWNLAPGYANYSYPFLARAIAPGCLECHASFVKTVAGTQNGYEHPPFLETGIACERCHGPGLAHARTGNPADIVNPAKLDSERRDSVCEQCHLSGEVRVQRPGAALEFRAGQRFSDWATAFAPEHSSAQMSVTSHVANLAQSACKRASGERMWCGSCHDVHRTPSAAEKARWYRSKCYACHADSSCTENPAARLSKGNNCIACHMPRRPVTDAEHVVYTDHAIPRRPGKIQNEPNSPPLNHDVPLIALNNHPAGPRELGLAYAILAAREQNAAYRKRAFDLLREFLQNKPNSAPDDPEVLSYLADLYRSRGDDRAASPLFERLMMIDPSQSSAPAALGAYAMERGDYNQAIRLWSAALRISPALLLVRANLAVALLHEGRRNEARAVLEKALDFNPEFPAARKLLSEIK